jgi:hypothetical protein
MNEIAVDTVEKPAVPGFGIWLSLLAIGLTLNIIRGFGAVVALNARPEAAETDWIESALTIGISLLSLVALVLLLRRKRAFIPVMAGLLIINVLLGLVIYILVLASGVDVPDRGLLHLAMLGSIAIAGLWLAYLWKSEHVRKVCIN